MTPAKPLAVFFNCLTVLFFLGSGVTIAADTIAAEQLKNYQLGLSDARPAEAVTLAPVIGRWTFAPGSPLTIAHPFEHSKIDVLVGNSQYLDKGTQVATISGPSVSHFYHRLNIIEQEFQVAEQRYQSNQQLFKDNAISAEQWQQTLADFLKLADQYHETQVVAERFQQMGEDRAAFTMPADGIWQLADEPGVLGTVLPKNSLRIGARVPQQLVDHVVALTLSDKQYAVSFRDKNAQNGLVTLWSEPAYDDSWQINQILSVQPSITIEGALHIPAGALTSLAGQPTVFIARNDEFRPVAVDIVAQHSDFYVVVPQQAFDGQLVTESIGALKGIYSDGEQ
ncbi:hypothetical protein LG288_07315 [Idiomarina seosinensis]|uniref:hypothetical protein n=1 Tax=Idiomarina seosinensis TaxID=281739 RepID=UPI00384B5FA9